MYSLGGYSRLHQVVNLLCLCRNTAWSPIRSALSLSKFFLITATATSTAWLAHPHLLNLAAHVLHLDFKDSVTAFQTSFFSFLSLVFAIYSGNTMAFLYDVSICSRDHHKWCCTDQLQPLVDVQMRCMGIALLACTLDPAWLLPVRRPQRVLQMLAEAKGDGQTPLS